MIPVDGLGAPVYQAAVAETPKGRQEPVPYPTMAPRVPEGPVRLQELVPGEGPLELDLGFGRGMSLFSRAEAEPGVRLLGLEIKAKWAFKVAERLAREGLAGRVAVYAADARELLARAGPEGCLARVFIHFPDPWWKKRHAGRRVVSEGLLDDLARLLAPGGELFIQTDVQDRAETFRDLLHAHPRFELQGEDGFIGENPFSGYSNRERRATDDGLPVWRILARGVGAT